MTHTLNAGETLPDTSGRASLLAQEPHILAWAITAIALVGYIVLTALGIDPPAILDVILGGSFGSASSLSWPRRAG